MKTCVASKLCFPRTFHLYRATPRLGTLEYMAPEILRCDATRQAALRAAGRSGYGKEVDVWAIGVIKGSNAVSIGYDEVGQAYKWLALLYDAVYIAFAP